MSCILNELLDQTIKERFPKRGNNSICQQTGKRCNILVGASAQAAPFDHQAIVRITTRNYVSGCKGCQS